MARVNVEQKALTDPRFDLLGRFLESTRHDALGRMVLVWNECQERNSYTLPERLVGAVMGDREGARWLVEADLAEWVDDDRVRIKGTEGRVEWLAAKRQTARANGQKGGRPSNQSKTNEEPTSVSHGFPSETPPAPAPAPAPEAKSLPLGTSRGGPRSRTPFVPPTVEEVAAYVATRPVKIDPQRFVDHYTANGWVQGRQGKPVKDWKACVRTWEGNNFGGNGHATENQRRTGTASFDPARHKLTPVAERTDAGGSDYGPSGG